jgi:hypothetical protein
MKKVSTIEMLQDGKTIGWSCVIKWKGKKPFGVLENGGLKIFPTKAEAYIFGRDFDIEPTK